MIERRRKEAHCVVTIRAVRRRERGAGRRVIRVGCSLPSAAVEFGKMASGVSAIRGLNGQRGVVAVVALIATRHQPRGRYLVRICQWEASVGVVEG